MSDITNTNEQSDIHNTADAVTPQNAAVTAPNTETANNAAQTSNANTASTDARAQTPQGAPESTNTTAQTQPHATDTTTAAPAVDAVITTTAPAAHDAQPQTATGAYTNQPIMAQSAGAAYNTASDNGSSANAQSHTTAAPKKKAKTNGKTVFAAIVVIALLCGVYTTVNTALGKDTAPSFGFTESPTFNYGFWGKNTEVQSVVGTFTDDYIAEIAIKGTIEELNSTYDQQWLLDTIEELSNDDKNCGIMLFIESPGGAVYQADDLYRALKQYQDGGKPVWAYLGSIAASGGYYVACSAETILSNRNTLTGSIGVLYGPSIDLTELMQKYGVKMTTFKAGKNKNMLNIDSPVTDEQAHIMQSVVDEAYEQFAGIVAESRNLPIEDVYKIADGRIYTANQAYANGLIDGIYTYEDAKDQMITELYGEDAYMDFQVIEKAQKQTLYDYLMDTSMRFTGNGASAEDVLLQKARSFPKGPAYFYPF